MILYRDGYDGQLAKTAQFHLPENLWPAQSIESEFINLSDKGLLTIKSGYAWDYASVPLTHWLSNNIQGKKSKIPSLVHDALCQLIRQHLLTIDNARLHADEHFYQLLLQYGFWKVRAWCWFQAVKYAGIKHHQEPKKVHTAP